MSQVACPCCGQKITDPDQVLFDPEGGFVVANGCVAALTEHEAELFSMLLNARPRLVEREKILGNMYWLAASDDEPQIKIIDVYVCKIRRKLRGMPIKINTVWGKGYRMILDQKKETGNE